MSAWRAKAALGMVVCSLAAALIGAVKVSASPQPGLGPSAVFLEGRFAEYGWGVAVDPDRGRKGVCMLVAILRHSGTGPGEDARCSAPALTRGNVVSLSVRRRGGGIALTVLGGAFNSKIAKVQAVMLDGKVKVLPFREPRAVLKSRHLSRFRYVALAVHGPWCIAELVTRERDGSVMFRSEGGGLLDYSPEYQCRERGGSGR